MNTEAGEAPEKGGRNAGKLEEISLPSDAAPPRDDDPNNDEQQGPLSLAEKRSICAAIARGKGKDSDRLAAMKLDNDLAENDGEAQGPDVIAALMRKIVTGNAGARTDGVSSAGAVS